MKQSLLLLALLLLLLPAPSSVSAQTDKVDDYIQAELKKRQIPGLALVVIKNGEVVKEKGYGFANLEHDVPVTPDTVFELASVTKQFTATAIMSLVEQGRVKLDDPLVQYLPNSPEQWKGITVRHLLTHTAGLASLENGFKALSEGGARTSYSTAQMFEAATKDPMSSAPGERWQYSDVGYFLLGMIIEKVSGQRYRDFLAERFFKPLGMTSTTVLNQFAIVKNRAAGYTIRDGQLMNIRRIAQVELPSHFGIFSSVRDLAKWDNALATGKVLKEASLAAMWTPVTLNNGRSHPYGFGWEVYQQRGHRVINHTGITGTEYSRYPDDKLTVIVLTNLGQHVGAKGVNAWGLTHGVAALYIPALKASFLWVWFSVVALLCLITVALSFKTRTLPAWLGYASGACAAIFAAGAAARATDRALWLATPLGGLSVLWLLVTGVTLARAFAHRNRKPTVIVEF